MLLQTWKIFFIPNRVVITVDHLYNTILWNTFCLCKPFFERLTNVFLRNEVRPQPFLCYKEGYICLTRYRHLICYRHLRL